MSTRISVNRGAWRWGVLVGATVWLAMGVSGIAGQPEDEATPAATPAEPPNPVPSDEDAKKIAALKARYQDLRARKEAIEEEIAKLEGAPGSDGDEAEEGEPAKEPAKAGTKLGAKKGGGGGGARTATTGAKPPKSAKVAAPPEEQIEKLEERLAKIEKELRAIEREAAAYGLGGAGLMKK